METVKKLSVKDFNDVAEEYLANVILESGEININTMREAIKRRYKEYHKAYVRKSSLNYYYKNKDKINAKRREKTRLAREAREKEKMQESE
jgi:hypothetical protein